MTAFAARTEERNTPGKLEKEKEGERREKEIKTGETIIFPMNMSDSHPIPFGVGRVLEIRGKQDLKFQWMGNTTCSARGTFLPGWIDPKDKKFY